jgi:hypothetical protein
MIHAEVAHHSAEGATVGLSSMNELRLASHANDVHVAAKPRRWTSSHAFFFGRICNALSSSASPELHFPRARASD